MHEKKPMTVKELCDYLIANFGPDTRVLGDAYEDGYDDVIIKEMRVYKRGTRYYWDGAYSDEPSKRDSGNFKAVIITALHRSD